MGAMENGLDAGHVKTAKGTTAASNNTPSSEAQGDTAAALAFLKHHTRHWEEDWYVQLVFIESDSGAIEAISVSPRRIDKLAPWIKSYQGKRGIYFCVNPLKYPKDSKAGKYDIAALTYLHADIDPHDGAPLADERQRLRGEIEHFPISPSELVDSGNGFGVFFKLADPVRVEGNAEELEEWNRRLAQHLGADHCYDICRIMRMPGTMNMPSEKKVAKGRSPVPVPAKLVSQSDAAYSLEQFDFLPPVETQHSAAVADIDLTGVNEATLTTWLQTVSAFPDLAKLLRGEAPSWTKDTSRSGRDFALARVLAQLGRSDDEIAWLLLRYEHGKAATRADPKQYIRAILKKVRVDFPADPSAVPGTPTARHLCTDQANAERLRRAIDGNVMFSAGRWFVWDGTHWSSDEAGARRQTLNLSALILDEANGWERKEAKSEEEAEKNREIVKALRKWSAKSEDKPRLDAAFAMLRWLVEVPADRLDADPYLLNVLNGTVDLRTGTLRPHDKGDLITKLIPIAYHPDARAPLFEKTLAEITDEAGYQRKPLSEFLQRWFGYCATGLTSEQVFAVHHGDGANGKSLLLGAVERVLGPYAGTAAPGLLVGGAHDRHPTELADLRGKRMVSACESSENGVLNEEFIKRATGGDRIKARFMRQDFFEFQATHKLQLLTNHKPQIRGQDWAIWRRVLLIPYNMTFGTPEAVEQGEAHHVRDDALAERLKAEDEGILAWIVKGAGKWYQTGLRPPDSILAAGAAYREEQDRVGQFLQERCERHSGATVPLKSLFSSYQSWARDCGFQPLGRNKFAEAVEKRPGITAKGTEHGKVFTGLKLIFTYG